MAPPTHKGPFRAARLQRELGAGVRCRVVGARDGRVKGRAAARVAGVRGKRERGVDGFGRKRITPIKQNAPRTARDESIETTAGNARGYPDRGVPDARQGGEGNGVRRLGLFGL